MPAVTIRNDTTKIHDDIRVSFMKDSHTFEVSEFHLKPELVSENVIYMYSDKMRIFQIITGDSHWLIFIACRTP